MDQDRFWELVEAARAVAGGGLPSAGHPACGDAGAALAEEIGAFERHSVRLLDKADRWDLRGAAYQINSGCSDDGFVYFPGTGWRAWRAPPFS